MKKCPICETTQPPGRTSCSQCASNLKIHSHLETLEEWHTNKEEDQMNKPENGTFSVANAKIIFYTIAFGAFFSIGANIFLAYLTGGLITTLKSQNGAVMNQNATLSETNNKNIESLSSTARVALESLVEEQKFRKELLQEIRQLREKIAMNQSPEPKASEAKE